MGTTEKSGGIVLLDAHPEGFVLGIVLKAGVVAGAVVGTLCLEPAKFVADKSAAVEILKTAGGVLTTGGKFVGARAVADTGIEGAHAEVSSEGKTG